MEIQLYVDFADSTSALYIIHCDKHFPFKDVQLLLPRLSLLFIIYVIQLLHYLYIYCKCRNIYKLNYVFLIKLEINAQRF